MAAAGYTCAGEIDESGYLASLSRQGFNDYKCVLELCGNSIDAKSTKVLFSVKSSEILMIDNGNGMNVDQLKNMFALHRENHSEDKSCGVSGLGGKVSQMILSKKNDVYVYTRNSHDSFVKAYIPWEKMFDSGKYTDMIEISDMIPIEKEWFKSELETCDNNETGTIIKFPLNDSLIDIISDNFKTVEERDTMPNLNEMIYIVYGRFDTEFLYKHYETPKQIKSMKKYNYFESGNNMFYSGKEVEQIIHYYNKKCDEDRYIWEKKDGTQYEIIRFGRGYSKKLTKLTKNLSGYECVGEFKVTVGQRRDNNVFDEENPLSITTLNKMFKWQSAHHHSSYDKNMLYSASTTKIPLHENVWKWLTEIPLIRNNQQIGKFAPPEYKPSSARGSAEAYHEYFGVRAELSYDPICTQDNRQDIAMNIQQNKNQWQSKDMPINLIRLVKAIRKEKAKKIWKQWNDTAGHDTNPEIQQQEGETTLPAASGSGGSSFADYVHDDDLSVKTKPSVDSMDDKPEIQQQECETTFPTLSESGEDRTSKTEIDDDHYVVPKENGLSVELSSATDDERKKNTRATDIDYRKGFVSGSELKDELKRVLDQIDDEMEYKEEYLKLFNKLRHIK